MSLCGLSYGTRSVTTGDTRQKHARTLRRTRAGTPDEGLSTGKEGDREYSIEQTLAARDGKRKTVLTDGEECDRSASMMASR